MFRIVDVMMIVMQPIMAFAFGMCRFAVRMTASVMRMRQCCRGYHCNGEDGNEEFAFIAHVYGSGIEWVTRMSLG